MRIFTQSLALPVSLVTMLSGSALAAEFEPLKKGEWKIEVIESSLGPATSMIKPQLFCVDETMTTASWEKRMKEESAKTKMDCDFKELAKDATSLSYAMNCKGTDASAANSMPAGSKIEGTMSITRENDVSYFMEQDTKASGLGLDEKTLAKIPPAQRAAVAGMLATQSNGMHIKMKQHYSYVAAVCSKPKKDAPKAK